MPEAMRPIGLTVIAMIGALGPAAVAARAQMATPPRMSTPTPTVRMPAATPPVRVNPTPGGATPTSNTFPAGPVNSTGSPFNTFANPVSTGFGQTPFNPASGFPVTPFTAAQLYGGSLSGQTNPYANPGTSSASQNPYGSSGYSGYYETPEGGLLRGTAELVNSQGKWLVSLQQASLLKEQTKQARIATRGKQFDEYVHEQSQTPTFEANREAFDSQRLIQSLNQASEGDILSGQALNVILADVAKTDDRAVRGPVAPLDNDVLQHVNLTSGRGANAGLLNKDGPLTWPAALLAEGPKADREHIDELIPRLRRQALSGRVDAGTVKDMAVVSQRMRQELKADVKNLSAKQYTEASGFLKQMDDAVLVLSGPDAHTLVSRQNAQGKDVAELARYMILQGLRFAPAAPGDEGAYAALHRALVAYDGTKAQLVREGK
jgi:hypothetical protein